MNIKLKVKRFFKKFFLIDDTPHKIAAGAAIGIFMGIFPGEGVISTLIAASIFKFNRLSATAGVLATNMWATIAVLPAAGFVGAKLFGKDYAELVMSYQDSFHLGLGYFFGKFIFLNLTLPLIVGFFAVSGTIALSFYFLLLFLIKKERRGHLFKQ